MVLKRKRTDTGAVVYCVYANLQQFQGNVLEGKAMKFELLADSIKQINDKASSAAKSAVNQQFMLKEIEEMGM